MKFSQAVAPDSEYHDWKNKWTPPEPRPRAIPGYVIVEFSPFGTPGPIYRPEGASNNAFVVADGYEGRPHREGYLPVGMEVAYTGTDGDNFTYQGRVLCRVKRDELEMFFPKEAA